MIVLDASAAVDLLLRVEPNAGWVAEQVASEREWHGPELVDPEVLHALRRRVLLGLLTHETAAAAVLALLEMPLQRYPHRPFARRMWELRGQLTPYDAAYVALAEALGASLVTTDVRLARVVSTAEVIAPA